MVTTRSAKKIRAARKEARDMSPTTERLHIPEGLTLSPRDLNPQKPGGAMVLRAVEGWTLAGIDPPRPDELPN